MKKLKLRVMRGWLLLVVWHDLTPLFNPTPDRRDKTFSFKKKDGLYSVGLFLCTCIENYLTLRESEIDRVHGVWKWGKWRGEKWRCENQPPHEDKEWMGSMWGGGKEIKNPKNLPCTVSSPPFRAAFSDMIRSQWRIRYQREKSMRV